MAYGIKIVGLGDDLYERPEWLRKYDPDAHEGRGWLDSTTDPAKARRFDSHAAAWEEWMRVSTVQPLRMDGKPNRPLTVFHVEISPLPEREEQQ